MFWGASKQSSKPLLRNYYFALKIFSHTKNIRRCHFILHTNRILAERSKGYINIIIFTMFCKIDGEMGISWMINIAARCFHPDTCTAQPPHCYVSRLNDFIFNVFNQPVPHSGNVLIIQLSLVISETLLIVFTSLSLFVLKHSCFGHNLEHKHFYYWT